MSLPVSAIDSAGDFDVTRKGLSQPLHFKFLVVTAQALRLGREMQALPGLRPFKLLQIANLEFF